MAAHHHLLLVTVCHIVVQLYQEVAFIHQLFDSRDTNGRWILGMDGLQFHALHESMHVGWVLGLIKTEKEQVFKETHSENGLLNPLSGVQCLMLC